MYNCPNCGSSVNAGEVFCKACGGKLPIPQNNQGNVNVNNPMGNIAQNNMLNQNNYGLFQNNINNDELIDAYIGNNVDKLKDGGFSLNTFFFGYLYVLYRKMWQVGFIWLAGIILISFVLPIISSIAILIANTVMAFQFKSLYMKNVEKNVEKIKSENNNKTKDELIAICRKKGGTTIVPVIIVIILFVISICIIIASFFIIHNVFNNVKDNTYKNLETEINDIINNDDNTNITNNNTSSSSDILDEIEITIPSDFTLSTHSLDNLKMYSLETESDNCSFKLISKNNIENINAQEFLENDVYCSSESVCSNVSQKLIKNNVWYYADVVNSFSKKYFYAIVNNNKIYEFDYTIVLDNSKTCSNAYNTIVNSLNFK